MIGRRFCKFCKAILKRGEKKKGVCLECQNINWKQFIKSRCQGCRKKIKNSLKRYIERGNFCEECYHQAKVRSYLKK